MNFRRSLVVCFIVCVPSIALSIVRAADVASFAPVPQVSLSVPGGWTVCDEKTGRMISNGVAPSILEKDPCSADASSGEQFILKSTDLNSPGLGFLFVKTDSYFTPKSLETLPSSSFPQLQKALCDRSATLMQYAPDSCVVAPATIAGETALLGEAIGTINGRQAKTHVRIIDFAYTGGTILLIFAGAADRPQPAIDAIMKSITIN